MFRNYLKVALRHIAKHKGLFAVNVGGLSLALACCLLTALYVAHETTYDNYQAFGDRIFRVIEQVTDETGTSAAAVSSGPVAPALEEHYPQVEAATRCLGVGPVLVRGDSASFYESGLVFADQDLLDILTFHFLRGDSASCLVRPHTIVLTQSVAQTYFGADDPVGRALEANDETFEITGVIADPPERTHAKPRMLASMVSLEGRYPLDVWFLSNFYTYVKLREGVDPAAFGEQMRDVAHKYAPEGVIAANERYDHLLQAVPGIHLHSHLQAEAATPGNPTYVLVAITIGLVLLALACINFWNLSTARAAERAEEIGMRKVVGADRAALVRQFLFEPVLVAWVAMLMAVVLLEMSLPWVQATTGIPFASDLLRQPAALAILAIAATLIGLTAGSYPALHLSRFSALTVFRGAAGTGGRTARFRRVLVAAQFVAAAVLAAVALGIHEQVDFMRNADLGIDCANKVVIPFRGADRMGGEYAEIKSAFLSHSSITGATATSRVPGQGFSRWDTWLVEIGPEHSRVLDYLYADEDLALQFGLKMLCGGPPRPETGTDSLAPTLLNRTATEQLGFASPDLALGRLISTGDATMEVVGVVEDFHVWGLQGPIPALAMPFSPSQFGGVTLSTTSDGFAAAIEHAREVWNRVRPDRPFRYTVLDDEFRLQYVPEERLSVVLSGLTTMALVVACLGLFGLASLAASSRGKEIGIRKVLGASVAGVVSLLSREVLALVIVANVIAWPLSYLLVHNWLEGFAFRMQIGARPFVFTAVLTMLTSLLTVGYQAVRAATRHPADAIRYR